MPIIYFYRFNYILKKIVSSEGVENHQISRITLTHDTRTNFMTVTGNYQIVRDSQDCGVSCEDVEKDISWGCGSCVWLVNSSLNRSLFANRHRMNLEKSLTAVCLESPGRCILSTCDIHRPLWLVSVYGELKWLSRGNLCQADILSGATASNSCRKNIGLSKLSVDSTLYQKAGFSSSSLPMFSQRYSSWFWR